MCGFRADFLLARQAVSYKGVTAEGGSEGQKTGETAEVVQGEGPGEGGPEQYAFRSR
jgi:hypothetical protein